MYGPPHPDAFSSQLVIGQSVESEFVKKEIAVATLSVVVTVLNTKEPDDGAVAKVRTDVQGIGF